MTLSSSRPIRKTLKVRVLRQEPCNLKCHKKEFGGGEGRLVGRTALSHCTTTISHGSSKLFWCQKASPILLPSMLLPLALCPWPRTHCVSVGCQGDITQTYVTILALLHSIALPFCIDLSQYDHLEKQSWLQWAALPFFATNPIFA